MLEIEQIQKELEEFKVRVEQLVSESEQYMQDSIVLDNKLDELKEEKEEIEK